MPFDLYYTLPNLSSLELEVEYQTQAGIRIEIEIPSWIVDPLGDVYFEAYLDSGNVLHLCPNLSPVISGTFRATDMLGYKVEGGVPVGTAMQNMV